jgi:hypothetical protein
MQYSPQAMWFWASRLRFRLDRGSIISKPNVGRTMQDHEPPAPGVIGSIADVAGDQLSRNPADDYRGDLLRHNPDGSLVLLNPPGNRGRALLLVMPALLAGLGLGWVGASYRHLGASLGDLNPFTQKEPVRTSDERPGRTEGARKTTSTSALQTPAVASTASAGPPPSLSGKSAASSSKGAHLSTDWTGIVHSALHTSATASASAPTRESLLPAPETKPTTITGWTVIDVRGGTAVLEGPDGVWRATRGDTVPGIGRIESIVRWGNRWIVATASGLIATP